MDSNKTKDYWDKNIEHWGKFYLDMSHSDEEFNVPRWLSRLYHSFISPIEARLMTERFHLTIDFIDCYVREGHVAVDIGCGTGVFTVEMLRGGAMVKALDISVRTLTLTRALVERLVPEHAHKVEYLLTDVSKERIPDSDVALAMGVTPYVENLDSFYGNILPATKLFFCLVLDPRHWANRLRRFLPILNVRRLRWFEKDLVDSLLARYNWRLLERRDFASGYLDVATAPDYQVSSASRP